MAPKRSRNEVLGTGAVVGALAYLLGYVVTFGLASGEARREFGEAVPTWKVVGWFHYNAHFVDLVSSSSLGGFGDATVVSLIAESSGTAGPVLYVVPPLALLLAGVAVTRYLDAGDVQTAATGGAAMVVGYGLLAVVGALAVAHTVEGSFLGVELSASVSVPPVETAIVAGLLYPAVFGTAGAVAATLLD